MAYITRKKRHGMWRVALTYALCERHGENYQVGTLTDAIRLARQKNALLNAAQGAGRRTEENRRLIMHRRYMQLRRANHWHPHDPMNPWGRCEQCEERCHEDFLLEVEEGDEVRVLCPECAEEAKAGKFSLSH